MAKKKAATVRKKKVQGVPAYDIPDAVWKCPDCGTSVPNLVHEEALMDLPEPWMGAEDYVVCYACDWSGTVEDVAQHILDSADQVECPCCHGKGTVSSERGETFSVVPPDVADAKRAFHIVGRIARFAEESFTGYTILSAIAEEIKLAESLVKRKEEE